ncbi:hypothetical protein [Alkalispirochaeta alkalica]|uniref:hypothetical protein n=1 Tax=Alkalispirochaeta alkalica TaxID=46356 RepID=UPI0012FD3337|nr:hypothetical protein [Alkalispirochaeta alkalica]
MFGCLHCRPPGGSCERTCPVCKGPVPAEGYVIARMFARHDKKHLRVLGCTACRKDPAGGSRPG